ncbi:glycosyltransferase family 2 protein [Sedimentitalea nanhaiensis]|uniref:Glycosyl transferase family 2 n=1 Tax=Sedimentitalea nanhaiensis TaxID=999627 RepID=A0A1I7D137_9RHOB|nr:glycosyltransferase family 2 protein [Sedimentitalea nanhaiensis]SFU05321.1 Glycosyl transferase family 2 [Sedimentitalea nanhaiensis]
MTFLAVLTVRNEGAYLLEWLAHHRAVGFTDFLVFSNDCQDGTDIILDRLQDMGWLTHVRNEGPYAKGGIQFSALKQAAQMDIVRSAEWILALDIDEFVNIHVGDHSLGALLAALPEATAITLTWRLFGNAGIVEYTDVPVTQTFTRCAPAVMYWPWRSVMFKTLFRNDGTYRKLGVHRPRNPVPERLSAARWFDGEGRELDDRFKHKRQFSDYGRPNHGLVQLNHYPLGAMASYLLKADRGRAVHSHQILDVDYWVERNFNTDSDRSILRTQSQSDPLLHTLHSDSDLATLHAQAVSWRQDRFQFLMEQEPFRALFARLLMTAPSRPITANAAIQLTRYALKGLHSGTDGAT